MILYVTLPCISLISYVHEYFHIMIKTLHECDTEREKTKFSFSISFCHLINMTEFTLFF